MFKTSPRNKTHMSNCSRYSEIIPVQRLRPIRDWQEGSRCIFHRMLRQVRVRRDILACKELRICSKTVVRSNICTHTFNSPVRFVDFAVVRVGVWKRKQTEFIITNPSLKHGSLLKTNLLNI